MSIKSWVFEMPESYIKTQRILKNITPALESWNRISQSVSCAQNLVGLTAAVTSAQKSMKYLTQIRESTSLISQVSTLQKTLSCLDIPKVENLIPGIQDIISVTNRYMEMPKIDWYWLNNSLSEYESSDIEETTKEVLTAEIRKEIDESVQEIVSSNASEDAVKSKFLEWQNQHPVLAVVFIQILLAIIINIASGVIGDWLSGVVMKKANLYEEPTTSSEIIINIDVDQNITIVNDVPYYYEVIYTDPVTGKDNIGYIYKPNVIIKQDENTKSE